jgi:chaperone BCS1
VYIDKATTTDNGDICHLKRNELFCLNTKADIENLKAFTRKLFEVRNRQNRDERIDNLSTIIFRGRFNNSNIWLNTKLRTFDDVFIPSADKEKIMNHVNAFIDKRDWYIKNNIPHHLGIMLYGEPGTGKSSIAQAIVDSINNVSDFIIVEGNEIKYIDSIFDNLLNQHAYDSSLYRVILFEDVDTGLSDINRDKSESLNKKMDTGESKETDLAGILNFLDGIRSPTNCIFIFTTNHIENIDQAILRPGRCDVSVEIKNVCIETLLEFLNFHFPEENITLPKTYKVKDGITFAELQNHIAIGETSDDIIKFCKRGKSE